MIKKRSLLKTPSLITAFILPFLILAMTSCGGSSSDPTVFEIKIENTSRTPSFSAQNGTGVINVFSSVIAAVHLQPQVLFTRNAPDYRQGLQNLAENGDVSVFLSSFRVAEGVEVIGVATEPSTGNTGILAPGQSFTLLLSASSKDSRLSLASSFLQGNDILLMTTDSGVPLFTENGSPISGDITNSLAFYDLGTERNEAPGIGTNQVLRQSPNIPEGQVSAGTPENQPVRLLSDVNDGFSYPGIAGAIRVTINIRELGSNTGNPQPSPSATASPAPSLPSPSPTVSLTPSPSMIASPSPSPSGSPSASSSVSPSPSPGV